MSARAWQSWHPFEPQLGQYNGQEFAEFDYVLLSAAAHGLKVWSSIHIISKFVRGSVCLCRVRVPVYGDVAV